jgi:hypothetical protein
LEQELVQQLQLRAEQMVEALCRQQEQAFQPP